MFFFLEEISSSAGCSVTLIWKKKTLFFEAGEN